MISTSVDYKLIRVLWVLLPFNFLRLLIFTLTLVFNQANSPLPCVFRKTFLIIFALYLIFRNTLINMSGSH